MLRISTADAASDAVKIPVSRNTITSTRVPENRRSQPDCSRAADGATLAGLLVIVIVLGALTATAIIGVSSLTGGSNGKVLRATIGTRAHGTGGSGGSGGSGASPSSGSALVACRASADAARAASAVYYANTTGTFPTKWSDLTASNPPLFPLADRVVVNVANPAELDGRGWKLVMTGGGTTQPTFTCG